MKSSTRSSPLVSVLIPVHNGERYLREAIESMLNQTYRNLEIIIIDDGSTDQTASVANRFSDSRIRFINQPVNIGLVATLNNGIQHCSGEFIARMDADDVSEPERIEKQVKFLLEHPDIGLLGTAIRVIAERQRLRPVYTNPDEIKSRLLYGNPINHPTVMIRTSTLGVHRYDPSFIHAEDYELWCRMKKTVRLSNLPEALLQYRSHPQQISRTAGEVQLQTIKRIHEQLLHELGLDTNEKTLRLHLDIYLKNYRAETVFIREAEMHLLSLIKHNQTKRVYPVKTFGEITAAVWFEMLNHLAGYHREVYQTYKRSPLKNYLNATFTDTFRFYMKQLKHRTE